MPQRRIYLVRHGVAEDYSDSGRDFDRRLTTEGHDKMARVARGLAELEVSVDLLVSSPLIRAIETADGLAAEFSGARREVWDELACGVDEIAFTARLAEVDPGANVMLVGHEPDIGELLAYWLTGRMGGFYTRVRKGSVSCLQAGSLPPDGAATFEWMMTAKQLGAIAR
ncbi:MAG: phosphohistidine phosphatase SixA [Candidatus Binatia bacterium]|nr:phosphohistidine phosphatase SixA [Candidatus Binatia bacterium]